MRPSKGSDHRGLPYGGGDLKTKEEATHVEVSSDGFLDRGSTPLASTLSGPGKRRRLHFPPLVRAA